LLFMWSCSLFLLLSFKRQEVSNAGRVSELVLVISKMHLQVAALRNGLKAMTGPFGASDKDPGITYGSPKSDLSVVCLALSSPFSSRAECLEILRRRQHMQVQGRCKL
jgi:hypothetical protein